VGGTLSVTLPPEFAVFSFGDASFAPTSASPNQPFCSVSLVGAYTDDSPSDGDFVVSVFCQPDASHSFELDIGSSVDVRLLGTGATARITNQCPTASDGASGQGTLLIEDAMGTNDPSQTSGVSPDFSRQVLVDFAGTGSDLEFFSGSSYPSTSLLTVSARFVLTAADMQQARESCGG